MNKFLSINLDYKNRLEEVLINGANYPEFVFKNSFDTYYLYESPILDWRDLVFDLCILSRSLLNDEVYFSFGQLESKEYGQYIVDGTDPESIEASVDFLNAEHWNYFGQYPLVISNSNIDWLVYESEPGYKGLLAFKNKETCSAFFNHLDIEEFMSIDEAKNLPSDFLDIYHDIRPFIANYSKD